MGKQFSKVSHIDAMDIDEAIQCANNKSHSRSVEEVYFKYQIGQLEKQIKVKKLEAKTAAIKI